MHAPHILVDLALASLACAPGMLLGVNSLGAVADQLGRRRGFLLSALVLGAAGLASALAPSFAVSRSAQLLWQMHTPLL